MNIALPTIYTHGSLPARLGVIMGGMGPESEVSFNSGRTIIDHLVAAPMTCVPIFHDASGNLYLLPAKFLHRGKISDFQHRLASQARRISWHDLPTLVDMVYIALHGRYAEDGTVQGMLEILHMPYIGSGVQASALGMDKSIHKIILSSQGIAVPSGITLNVHDDPAALKNLQYPVIIKPAHEGSSLGVSLVTHDTDLVAACLRARHVVAHPQPVLIEQYINGCEFTCTLLQQPDQSWIPLGITEIERPATGFWDYRHKYMPGLCHKWTPARVSEDDTSNIARTCIRVATILGMRDIARIDGFVMADHTIAITDPNTLSGSAPSSPLFAQTTAAGLTPAQLITHIIHTAYLRACS
jgi:D-alanine-D-alanine ligase